MRNGFRRNDPLTEDCSHESPEDDSERPSEDEVHSHLITTDTDGTLTIKYPIDNSDDDDDEYGNLTNPKRQSQW